MKSSARQRERKTAKRGKTTKPKEPPAKLQGWTAIASYLGVSKATAEHWAKTGMPVKREGRFTVATPDELRKWLGREAHMPGPAVLMPTPGTDISAALKESLSAVRRKKRSQ